MSIRQYQKGIKKRREERLKLLRTRKRQVSEADLPRWSEWEREYPGSSPPQESRSSALLFKTVSAILLVTVVLLVFNTDHPQLDRTKQFIQQAMSRDFNLDGLRLAYQEVVGTQAGLLPSLLTREEAPPMMDTDYVVPVSGARIISQFNPNQRGIILETGSTLPVEVIKEGWVTYVGEREGMGRVVIIDHGQGEESWYGHLQEVNVQLYDWVNQGDAVGTTSVPQGKEKGVLYFALRKDSVFIDPLDVITFE